MTYRIPFNKPCFVGRELEYVSRAVAGGQISGDGPFTRRAQEVLEKEIGAGKVLLTTSGTHALEMAALLLDLAPGDEVVVPSFTFVSTASAFALRGARPVFVDVRPDTLNLDERLVERALTPRTRAIVAVHYGGVGCEMEALLSIASRHGLALVEDNAHGLFARYRGRQLGTFGRLAIQSFHETKNYTCGEGGALVVNDPSLVERAEIVREKGTNRSRFFRGMVDKYTWVELGSSYVPSDLLAAFLLAQLEERAKVDARRREIWCRYAAELPAWAESEAVRLMEVPPDREPSHHLFYALLPSLESRQALIAHLRQRGILAVFHYQPLHLSTMGLRYGGRPGDCPVTEDVADRLLRLPLYSSLTEGEQSEVIAAVRAFSAR